MDYYTALAISTVVSLVLCQGIEYSIFAVFIFVRKPLWIFIGIGAYLAIKKVYELTKNKKRKTLINEQVGKTLLLLSQTLKSGMSLDQGFRLVESSVDAPIKEELQLIIKDVDLGKSWLNAIKDSEKRIVAKEWQSFVTAAGMAINMGGNLAEILSGLSYHNSQKEALERKLKSITAQGRLTAWILAMLPFAFFAFYWFIDRSRIYVFTNSLGGQLLLVLAFLLDAAGFFAIKRICEVKW
ncbi:MAG: type II secretion system F family protein [Firmicutes bacterium]|nr:type II secretion system F family protein [Bacillota bacterium]MDD4263130.1 type II secretion system F family protein [Bacillota bacterium]MDD4694179.1 type II secretion system F family protein [Bacillota bacterium]